MSLQNNFNSSIRQQSTDTSIPSSNKSLKILYYNARSVLYKHDLLLSESVSHSPDVICLTETWLVPEITDNELNINGYHLVRLDRDRHGGGVAIFINDSLSFSVLLLAPEVELLVISICSFAGNVCIALAYRPPSSSVTYFNTINNLLTDLIRLIHFQIFYF